MYINVVIPVFPGTSGEYELEDWFVSQGAKVNAIVFRNRTPEQQEESLNELANAINKADTLAIPSGMNADFVAAVLKNTLVKTAAETLLERNGRILGVSEGFNALVKTGLLPYGKFTDRTSVAVERNAVNKYICRMVNVRDTKTGEITTVPFSTQNGRIVTDEETFNKLSKNGQIAAQYTDDNPSGSSFAIESMTSPDGNVMGKMCLFERAGVCINL
jgi:phosphoribosylformylglycinamidine synthase